MDMQLGIKPENRERVAQLLSIVLSNEFIVYTKTRRAHWNIEGVDFHTMHTFFESQYEQLNQMMDEVAERIRTIGHYAPATLKEFLALTHLSERIHEKNDGMGFIKELLADHESIIIHLRENIDHIANELKDSGSSDFITGLMEAHEKMAWMLRTHLK